MTHRAALTLSAGLLALSAGALGAAVPADAAPTRLAAPAASGQCAESYVPLGADRSYATYLFGRTIVRFRNPSGAPATIQWWSSTSSGNVVVQPNSTYDLTRSFVGFRISIHVYGVVGVYVSFPIGPC